MKKTIFTITLIAIFFIIAMVGTVNAASVTASETEVNKGETVTVTIKTDAKIKSSDFGLKYDPAKFEYVSISTTLAGPLANNMAAEGVVYVAVSDPLEENATDTISLTFRAIADVSADEEVTFSVVEYTNNEGETLTSDSAKVTILKPVEEPPVDDPVDSDPTVDPDKDTTPDADKDEKDELIGTDGKPITKLPQTGTPVYMVAIALVVVAGAILLIRRVK